MTDDNLLQSRWLSDWRRFYDEAEHISPKMRRQVGTAITQAELRLEEQHRQMYRNRLKVRNTSRNEGVIGRAEELCEDLAGLIEDMEAGRVSPEDVLVAVRDVETDHRRITALHDALVSDEEELERFANLSLDEFQREMPSRFQVLNSMAGGPALADEVSRLDQVPNQPAFVEDRQAPSADDINWNES